jgi:hypothetical protein
MRVKNFMQRITVSLTDEQAERLKTEQQRSGAPVSLQIRRALDEDEVSRRAHTWINFSPAAPLSNEQLAALRTEATRLGRPLFDAEAKIVLGPIAGSTATRVVCCPDDNGVIV